ncbi:MAG TPA: hypothetical protein VL918_06820 [Sphingobium sp.]|nr:hypothetical protein [Sphingobium sp.]
MRQGQNEFERFIGSGFAAWRVSWEMIETIMASHAAIGTRLAGIMNPRSMPYEEPRRLIPERSDAFGKANVGAMQTLMAPATRAPQLTAALLQDGMVMLDWWERIMTALSAWWKPAHPRLPVNHRRLNGHGTVLPWRH